MKAHGLLLDADRRSDFRQAFDACDYIPITSAPEGKVGSSRIRLMAAAEQGLIEPVGRSMNETGKPDGKGVRDMGVWVLIIFLTTPTGAAMTTAEYGNRAACMTAGENIQAASANDGWRAAWSCNAKYADTQ